METFTFVLGIICGGAIGYLITNFAYRRYLTKGEFRAYSNPELEEALRKAKRDVREHAAYRTLMPEYLKNLARVEREIQRRAKLGYWDVKNGH